MISNANFRYTYTVFTPSYNRAHLLPRVFESLEKQTFRDFEWLIVDDGSKDNTAEVVKDLEAKAKFPVRYVVKPNGGKPTAVNRGAQEAQGRLIAILDSDDWYVPETLERFLHHWNAIPKEQQAGFVGVTGLCCFPSGEILGTRFPQDVFDSDAIDLRYKYNVAGEKSGMLRTDILRQHPFPEDLGRHVSESLIWNRIAKHYKTRFINEVLTIKEFQVGGLTRDGRMIQVRDTRASLLNAKELIALGKRLPLKHRVLAYSNYIRRSLHHGVPLSQQLEGAPSKVMFFICYPIGRYLEASDAKLIRNVTR